MAAIPKNGIGLPMAGFGTFQMSEEQAEASVKMALAAGWRHIDSAQGYRNEKGTGKAIKACGIPREELFITTKVFPGYNGWGEPEKSFDEVIAACKTSLEELQVDYCDLYLIHSPFASTRIEQWRAMNWLKKNGLAKHIGVSNYGPSHIKEIEDAGLPLPEVNEIEFHPLCQQKEMTALMQKKGILPIAYSSLASASGWRTGEGQGGEASAGKKAEAHKVQKEITERLGITEAQLLLSWGMKRGYAILTKSTNEERIKGNLDLMSFQLSDADAKLLDALDQNWPSAWISFGIPNPMEVITPLAATIYYFPAGGRGELSRCIAAAGGIPLAEGGAGGNLDKSEFGSPSGVPLLAHGSVRMSQSTAIENYLSLWAFPDLTPQQRAIDAQLCSIKEDVAVGYYKVFFNPELKEDKAKAAEELGKNASKWYPVIEKMCPADGFFNRLPYPTAADIAVLNMCDCVMAFEAGNRLGGVSWATYPKMRALATRTADTPNMKEYLAKSKTFAANPMGL